MLWKKVWPKVSLPKVVPKLVMRWLYTGGGGKMGWDGLLGDGMCVGDTSDQKADQMSS